MISASVPTRTNERPEGAWIAVDWGTTHLRVWMVSAEGETLRTRSSAAGMATLAPDGFEPALLELVGDVHERNRPTSVLCCGMVGARQGWIDAPYRPVPCEPISADALVRAPSTTPGLDIRIVPGLAQRRPADVMRGEETQIAGFLAERPGFSGLACLPGTHTKWVRLHDGRIEAFATAMSGELFALLADRSVLRHSVAAEGWDDAAFDEALHDALSSPAALSRRLFSLRAEDLLDGLDATSARSRLSGLLLGVELAGLVERAERRINGGTVGEGVDEGAGRAAERAEVRTGEDAGAWAGAATDEPVVVIGARELGRRYARALRSSGRAVEVFDGERLTLSGLSAVREGLVPGEPT